MENKHQSWKRFVCLSKSTVSLVEVKAPNYAQRRIHRWNLIKTLLFGTWLLLEVVLFDPSGSKRSSNWKAPRWTRTFNLHFFLSLPPCCKSWKTFPIRRFEWVTRSSCSKDERWKRFSLKHYFDWWGWSDNVSRHSIAWFSARFQFANDWLS